MSWSFAALGLVVATAVAIVPGRAASQVGTEGGRRGADAPSGNAKRGKQIYLKYGCYQCHGREAQGASTGSKLGPDPWPLAAFVQYVRSPAGDMPPYTARVIADAELADVYAFVASRPRPPVRPKLLVR